MLKFAHDANRRLFNTHSLLSRQLACSPTIAKPRFRILLAHQGNLSNSHSLNCLKSAGRMRTPATGSTAVIAM